MGGGLDALGEFGIIGLFRQAADPRRAWTVAGIGDDCAVLDAGGGERLLVTTDVLVERVHFLLSAISPRQLGYKAMTVNLSDIAAMGGEPTAAFLALALTPAVDADWVAAFRDGLLAGAREHAVDLLGGDTTSAERDLMVCLTILGRARSDQVVLRSGAVPGDRVYVGRGVGDSAAGLQLLLDPEAAAALAAADRAALLRAHLEPRPQVALGRALAAAGLARAMIDVSDGVAQDLGHICRASGVAAEIDAAALPLSAPLRRLAGALERDGRDWALHGGEDYCLLFCVPADRTREAEAVGRETAGADLHPIGRIVAGSGLRLLDGGTAVELAAGGWDHFEGR